MGPFNSCEQVLPGLKGHVKYPSHGFPMGPLDMRHEWVWGAHPGRTQCPEHACHELRRGTTRGHGFA